MTKIERWDTYEIALTASRAWANPFQDVTLTATFTHEPSGRTVIVDGFYDGNSTWRLRLMPCELGACRYMTTSADPGLDGHEGALLCIEPVSPYLHGPIAARGHHFVHADGTPRFLLST